MSRVPKAQRDARSARSRLVAEIAVSERTSSNGAGRKPEPGQRTPSGQLSRSKEATAERSRLTETMEQPHRRVVPKDMRRDQRAESEIGRLLLHGNLTKAQCEAGEKYRRLMREFSSVLATPMTTQSALASMVSSGTEDPAEDERVSEAEAEPPEEQRERVLGAYDGVTYSIHRAIKEHNERVGAAMLSMGPAYRGPALIMSRDVFNALDALAVRDEPIRAEYLQFAEFGLDVLARRWRLEDDGRREIRSEVGERPSWDHVEKIAVISYQER